MHLDWLGENLLGLRLRGRERVRCLQGMEAASTMALLLILHLLTTAVEWCGRSLEERSLVVGMDLLHLELLGLLLELLDHARVLTHVEVLLLLGWRHLLHLVVLGLEAWCMEEDRLGSSDLGTVRACRLVGLRLDAEGLGKGRRGSLELLDLRSCHVLALIVLLSRHRVEPLLKALHHLVAL